MTHDKAKFFALYWGQKVIRSRGGFKHRVNSHVNLEHESWWLELTPLSKISDEDFIEIQSLEGYTTKEFTNYSIDITIQGWCLLTLDSTDYLRSKGYALPWMGISVEEQISRGWVKLKE